MGHNGHGRAPSNREPNTNPITAPAKQLRGHPKIAMKGTNAQASELIVIAPNEWKKLFGTDADRAKRIWQKLASTWHPDRNSDPQAGHVFAHVKMLYEKAQVSFAPPAPPKEQELTCHDGSQIRIRWLREHKLEVGRACIGRTIATYLLEPEFDDLSEAAVSTLNALPYRDEKMRKAMHHKVPGQVRRIELERGSAIVIDKPKGLVPLADVHKLAGRGIDPRHVAWMTSSMLNLVCYLQFAKIAHQGMTVTNLLVDPAQHSIGLWGGWWWSGKHGEKLRALSGSAARAAPPDIMEAKKCNRRLDQVMVRDTARALLAEHWNETPQPMRDFIDLPPAPDAIDDYKHWMRILERSFGERKFVKLNITADDVYAMRT